MNDLKRFSQIGETAAILNTRLIKCLEPYRDPEIRGVIIDAYWKKKRRLDTLSCKLHGKHYLIRPDVIFLKDCGVSIEIDPRPKKRRKRAVALTEDAFMQQCGISLEPDSRLEKRRRQTPVTDKKFLKSVGISLD
jgi:hypothetical protein